jgi:DNA-binding NarL/FixJ family response regulator
VKRHEALLARHGLTQREREVFHLLERGLDNKTMASELDCALGTVKNHLTNIYQKLGVKSKAEAVAWAYRHRLR